MISDNYVTGDNIFLRELQSFFFEVLGMMSITHYGAIGDGRTDNYGPLQVAIDDAHRRGLSYIYVPYGRFIYTGELVNIGNLIFIGNPHSHIVNIRTGEEINIQQFGVGGTTYEAGPGIDIEGNVISATGTSVMKLTEDLILDGELDISSGFYNTEYCHVYLGSISASNLIVEQAEMFYFDKDTQTLITPFASYFYESGSWNVFQNSYIENELTDSRNKVPTSHAVIAYVDQMITQAIGGAY